MNNTLREAVERIRDDFSHEDVEDVWSAEFHLAVADWLEGATCALHCGSDGTREPYCSRCEDSTYDHECPPSEPCKHGREFRRALDAARAYLGKRNSGEEK